MKRLLLLLVIPLLAVSCNKQTAKIDPQVSGTILEAPTPAPLPPPDPVQLPLAPTVKVVQKSIPKPPQPPPPVVIPPPIPIPPPVLPPVIPDLCPNIEGNQSTSIPEGLHRDNAGNCVATIAPPPVFIPPPPLPVFAPPPPPPPIIIVPPPTAPDPTQIYKDCAAAYSKANQEVLDGFKAGGMANQTQINAMIRNQIAKDGFAYCLYLN